MSQRAAERWAAFLSQIVERHNAVSAEAEQSALETLRAHGYDPTPMATAWGAVHHRLRELETRIIPTWDEKVDATFEAEGVDHATRMAERAKGEEAAFRLQVAHELLEARVFSKCAREMHAHGVDGARVVAFGSHALAMEAAQNEYLAMRDQERANRLRRPPVALPYLKAYEQAQIRYWTKYFTAKAQVQPELRDIPLEVRSRMEPWYRSAEHEEEWVRGGRPRETI